MKKRMGLLLCVVALGACASKEGMTPEDPSVSASAETWGGSSSTARADSPDEASAGATPSNGSMAAGEASSSAAANIPGMTPASGERHPREAEAPPAAGARPGSTPPPARADADNTRVNERDRDASRKTPLDQGNNMPDLEITQKIRQAVMADGGLSFTAKNVKIITAGGKVTLRGPVNSAEERSKIEAAARRVAGDANVVNEIEIKS